MELEVEYYSQQQRRLLHPLSLPGLLALRFRLCRRKLPIHRFKLGLYPFLALLLHPSWQPHLLSILPRPRLPRPRCRRRRSRVI